MTSKLTPQLLDLARDRSRFGHFIGAELSHLGHRAAAVAIEALGEFLVLGDVVSCADGDVV